MFICNSFKVALRINKPICIANEVFYFVYYPGPRRTETVKFCQKYLLIRVGRSLVLPPLDDLRPPVDGVRFLRGGVVLTVYLDGLVGFGREQARARAVEGEREDAGLRVHGTGLHGRLQALEVVPRAPVPQKHGAVVAAARQHALVVHGQAVDDGVVARQVLDEAAVRAFPLLDVVWRRGRERVQRGVQSQRAHRLLVVGERAQRLAGRQVPQAHGGVVRTRDDLRLGGLARQGRHRVRVARQGVYVGLAAGVPHPGRGVAARRHQHVDGGVQRQRVHSRQVAVVVTNHLRGNAGLMGPPRHTDQLNKRYIHLVIFQVPTFHLSVFAATEQVGVTRRHLQTLDTR